MKAHLGRRLLRVAPWLLAAVVLWLVARQARSVDWAAVLASVKAQPTWRLALAGLVAVAGHALYASFDLIGRRLTHHPLSAARTMMTAAISYAFNLNFGGLLGGMAMRLRLYTRRGLSPAVVVQVIAVSMITNWLGYLLVGGVLLLLAPPAVPDTWPVGRGGLQALGAVMAALGLAYLALCALSPRREWRWRDHRFVLPPLPLALWQAGVAVANWMLMAAIVWGLLAGRVGFASVASTLLLAAVAGVIVHVPAGLGVLEAVFVAALGDRVAPHELLAALLAYRAAYYLLPLTWALPAYAFSEASARRHGLPVPPTAQAAGPRRSSERDPDRELRPVAQGPHR